MSTYPVAIGLVILLALVQTAVTTRAVLVRDVLVSVAFGVVYWLLGWAFGRERKGWR